MKKIISIFLALVMCFTMSTVAFAAEPEEETPEISKEGIINVLLEAAKLANSLNSEAREKLGEELEKLIVKQIAGDSVVLKQAAEWIVDKIINISGSDNILDIDKKQAEKIADFLTKMYDGNLAEYFDSPIIGAMVNLIPKEMLKNAVVWILSDGFGDALQEFIDKYGDGEDNKEDTPPAEENKGNNFFEILASLDIFTVITAAFKALRDVIVDFYNQFVALFNPQPVA